MPDRDWSIQRSSKTKHNAHTGNDDVFYNYFINIPQGKGQKDKRISLIPTDKGGYQNLEAVFTYDGKLPIHFRLANQSFTDSTTGEIHSYSEYEVFVITEDNKIVSARVKPWRTSDKDLLTNLLGKRTVDSISPDEILF